MAAVQVSSNSNNMSSSSSILCGVFFLFSLSSFSHSLLVSLLLYCISFREFVSCALRIAYWIVGGVFPLFFSSPTIVMHRWMDVICAVCGIGYSIVDGNGNLFRCSNIGFRLYVVACGVFLSFFFSL